MKHKAKFGLNSGNSFHFGSRLKQLVENGARHRNVVVKTYFDLKGDLYNFLYDYSDIAPPGSEDRIALEKAINRVILDGDLPISEPSYYFRYEGTSYQIELSLNKKRRWLLPRLISHEINSIRDEDESFAAEDEAKSEQYKRRMENSKRRLKRSRPEMHHFIVSELSEDFDPLHLELYRRPRNFRITLTHRLNSFIPPQPAIFHYRTPDWRRRPDCIRYDDTAGPKFQMPRRQRQSSKRPSGCAFQSDMRISALKNKIASCPGVEEGALTYDRRKPRTNRRGVQRAASVKVQRSVCRRACFRWRGFTADDNIRKTCTKVPEVRYEICTPRPLSSHRFNNDHKPNRFQRLQWDYGDDGLYKPIGGYQRKDRPKIDFHHYIRSMLSDIETDLFLSVDDFNDCNGTSEVIVNADMVDDGDLCHYEQRLPATCFCLADAIVTRRRSVRQKRNSSSADNDVKRIFWKDQNKASSEIIKRHGKGNAIYFDGPSPTFEDVSQLKHYLTTAADSSNELQILSNTKLNLENDSMNSEYQTCDDHRDNSSDEWFYCTVLRSSIDSLRVTYEQRVFAVGQSFPMRFLVDLSSRDDQKIMMSSLDQKENALFPNDNRPTCQPVDEVRLTGNLQLVLLVEEVIGEGENWNRLKSELRGYCRLRCQAVGEIHRTLKEKYDGNVVDNVRDVIDSAFTSSCSVRQQNLQSSSPQIEGFNKTKLLPVYHFICGTSKWSYDSVCREEAFHILERQHYSKEPLNWSTMSYEIEIPEVCGICENDIRDSSRGGVVRGIALSACEHWFCRDCWRHYLMDCIERHKIVLKCPGYNCSSDVDKVTLLTILPFRYWNSYMTYVREAWIDSECDSWRWCPNPKCHNILRQSTSTTNKPTSACPIVKCVCESVSCFKCGGSPHWPASCLQADLYDRMRQQTGDESQMPQKTFFVNIKRCPLCRYPIEKDGGCLHMSCVRCNKEFCWICKKEWSQHKSYLCMESGIQTMSVDRTSEVVFHPVLYAKAIEQRVKRLAVNHRHVLQQLLTRCLKIQRLDSLPDLKLPPARGHPDGVYLDFLDRPKVLLIMKGINQSTDLNVLQFLLMVMSFYLDARFSIEYCYVHKMSLTRRQAREVKQAYLDLLGIIADEIEELLFCRHGKSFNASQLRRLHSCFQNGVKCLDQLRIR